MIGLQEVVQVVIDEVRVKEEALAAAKKLHDTVEEQKKQITELTAKVAALEKPWAAPEEE